MRDMKKVLEREEQEKVDKKSFEEGSKMRKNSSTFVRLLWTICFFVFGIMCFGAGDAFAEPGEIVVNNDEWTLSDEGFAKTPDDARQFALNLASYFTGGTPGNFLVYSTPFGSTNGLVGDKLEDTMEDAGHTWTVISTTTYFSLDDLLQYDGIFLAGSAADNFNNPKPVVPPDTPVLIDYIKAGGNVYLAGGTDPNNPQGEADQWNPFLNACGLHFEPVQNDVDQIVPINSSHPIFHGVKTLFQRNGNSIIKLDPSDLKARILVEFQGEGLYAICSFAVAPQIIVTLDDISITQCGETWTESGVVLSIIETTEQDCGGGGDCSFGINDEPGVIWLWPARLNLDFSNLTSLTNNPILVEVDIYDACGPACTRAFLYDDGCTIDSANNAQGGHSETLLLFGGPGADQLSISSCEGGVYEIRLTPNPIVNNMVDFTPIPGTYVTIPFTNDFPPCDYGCPDGYAGLFSFQAMLENTSNTSLADLTVKVHTLTNENLLVLARGNSLPDDFVGAETGGEGALWTLPASGYYDGRILYQGPSKAALPRFGICLKEIKRFDFWVDVLGKVQ